jgi:hypothetical protein
MENRVWNSSNRWHLKYASSFFYAQAEKTEWYIIQSFKNNILNAALKQEFTETKLAND